MMQCFNEILKGCCGPLDVKGMDDVIIEYNRKHLNDSDVMREMVARLVCENKGDPATPQLINGAEVLGNLCVAFDVSGYPLWRPVWNGITRI